MYVKETARFGTYTQEVPASAMHVEPDASYEDLGERPAVGDSVLRFVEGAEKVRAVPGDRGASGPEGPAWGSKIRATSP